MSQASVSTIDPEAFSGGKLADNKVFLGKMLEWWAPGRGIPKVGKGSPTGEEK